MNRLIENKRIGDLEFRKATYLLVNDENSKLPSYNIDKWYPNTYYGKINDYSKVCSAVNGRSETYYVSDKRPNYYISEGCFKNPESSYTIASFDYDVQSGTYNFNWVADRPLAVINNQEMNAAFNELIKYGFQVLGGPADEEPLKELYVDADVLIHIKGMRIYEAESTKKIKDAITRKLGLNETGYDYEIKNIK